MERFFNNLLTWDFTLLHLQKDQKITDSGEKPSKWWFSLLSLRRVKDLPDGTTELTKFYLLPICSYDSTTGDKGGIKFYQYSKDVI